MTGILKINTIDYQNTKELHELIIKHILPNAALSIIQNNVYI